MFAVLFEVQPKSEKWDEYLGIAKLLKPELEAIDGFVENIRYRSLTRAGWLLSLSIWRDEKALVRWRTKAVHHGAQEKGVSRSSAIITCGSASWKEPDRRSEPMRPKSAQARS